MEQSKGAFINIVLYQTLKLKNLEDFIFDDLPFPQDFIQDKPLIDKYVALKKEKKNSFFDVEEFEIIIDYYIFTFDTKEAQTAVAKATSQHPDSNCLKIKKAYVLTVVGQMRKALILLQQVVSVEPLNYEVHQLMAMTYSKTGKTDKAIESYMKAITYCNKEEKVQIMIDLALEFSNVNRFDESLKLLKTIVLLNPKEDFAIYELQFCLHKAGRLDEGPAIFQQIIDLNPYSIAAWFNLGVCYGNNEKHTEALEAYDYALAINEKHTPSLFNKGNMLYQMEEYSKALEAYQMVVNVEEPMAITYCNMGECHEQLMEFEQALKYYYKALEMDPSFADAHIGCAIAEDLLGNTDKAVECIEKALKISPSSSDYRHFYAEMLKKAKQYDKAITVFEKALKNSKNDISTYLGYFDCLFVTNQDEKAMDVISQGFKNLGEQDELSVRFLALLTRQGKMKKASILLETLLNSNKSIGRKFLSYHPQASEKREVIQLINEYSH
ncbi:MAG: tetratricopeptide (TPR) repeat protein [Glaciecola sp.]